MRQQLSLGARPKRLSDLVGQQKIVAGIRGHIAQGTMIKAWLFAGPKGTGKTTIARILALSYQCTHQEFGEPCLACRKAKASFQIVEINASEDTRKDRMQELLEGADYGVMGESRYRVYILDECHKLTDGAQNLCLKYLEDSPETSIFILCSTAPQRIIETLRSRCIAYELRELEQDDALLLVKRLLKSVASKLPADRLADALVERGVRSPRLIAMAVEKYLAGLSPDDAAQVEGATEVNIQALTRSIVKGDWVGVSQALVAAQGLDVRAVRMSVIAYLRTVLLESSDIATRTEVVAKALSSLCGLTNAEDLVVSANLAAELYRVTAMFAKYKL